MAAFSTMGTLILLNQPRSAPVPGFVLQDGVFVCGRSTHCDFILPHPTISRRHAEFRVAGAQVEVVDLKSRNGTYVNGARVSTASLHPSTVLRLGELSFVINEQEAEDCSDCLETASTQKMPPGLTVGSPASSLSTAERRVLDLVLDGLAEKQIATRLHISQHTAHNHVRNIYRALDVHSRAELLARLVRRGGPTELVRLPPASP